MADWMKKLCNDYGKIAEDMESPSSNVVKFPSPSLNWALNNGGLTEGKAICFYGPESGGKSLLMYLGLIETQRMHPDGVVILFDAEFSFNKDWFIKLGGDAGRIVVYQTNDPVQIFDFIWGDLLMMLQDGMPLKAIGIDSVKSILYPGDVKDKSTNITMGGSGAKYLGPTLKRVLPIIRRFNITTFLVQQVNEELDPMKALRNPYIVPDGRALKHFCDYMVEVTKVETKKGTVERGKNIYGTSAQMGHTVRCKLKKNRVGAPARIAQFTLDYEKGITNIDNEVFELAKSLGLIFHPINPKTGKENPQHWQFGNMEPIRGEDNMRKAVTEDLMLIAEIIKACDAVNDEQLESRNADLGDTIDVDIAL